MGLTISSCNPLDNKPSTRPVAGGGVGEYSPLDRRNEYAMNPSAPLVLSLVHRRQIKNAHILGFNTVPATGLEPVTKGL